MGNGKQLQQKIAEKRLLQRIFDHAHETHQQTQETIASGQDAIRRYDETHKRGLEALARANELLNDRTP